MSTQVMKPSEYLKYAAAAALIIFVITTSWKQMAATAREMEETITRVMDRTLNESVKKAHERGVLRPSTSHRWRRGATRRSPTPSTRHARIAQVCKPLGLSVRGTGGEHTPIGADGTVDISPSKRLFIKERDIIAKLYSGISDLMVEEKKAPRRWR